MESYTLGDMITAMREERDIKQQDLCMGICSQKTMSRIELWTHMPDRLMLNLLLERLGKNTHHFVTMITKEERIYFTWKLEVLDCLNKGDMEGVRALLLRPEAQDTACNEKLQRQFYLYLTGYLDNDWEKMLEAISYTVPGILGDVEEIRCLSASEMKLILLYIQMRIATGWDGRELLRSCLHIIERYYEESLKAQIYPAAVQLYCRQRISSEEKVEYYEKAVKLLTTQNLIKELPILLKLLVQELRLLEDKRAERYDAIYHAFEEIYEEQGLTIDNEGAYFLEDNQESYTISEILKICRSEKNYSREEASDGICDVATYGRVESGSRGVNNKNFAKLHERLNLPYERFQAHLITTDYKCLQLSEQITKLLQKKEYEEAEPLLKELGERLDLEIPQNRQVYVSYENTLGDDRRKQTPGVFREIATKALRLSIPKWTEDYGIHFYTKIELKLVNHVFISYSEEKNYERQYKIWENLWKYLKTDEATMLMRAEEMILLLANGKNMLSHLGRYEESLRVTNYAIKLCLKSGHGDKLDTLLHEKSWLGDRMPASSANTLEKRIGHSIQAYYMSDVYGRIPNRNRLKVLLKENYDFEID